MVLMLLVVIRLDCFKTLCGKGTWENRAAVHETEGLQVDLHLCYNYMNGLDVSYKATIIADLSVGTNCRSLSHWQLTHTIMCRCVVDQVLGCNRMT